MAWKPLSKSKKLPRIHHHHTNRILRRKDDPQGYRDGCQDYLAKDELDGDRLIDSLCYYTIHRNRNANN